MSEAHAHGDHAHRHEHHHEHGHTHETAHGDGRGKARGGRILTIRSHSGLSGDMFLAGLLRMTELGEAETDRLLAAVLPALCREIHCPPRFQSYLHRCLPPLAAVLTQNHPLEKPEP